jgi:Recombination endonuclease VII.
VCASCGEEKEIAEFTEAWRSYCRACTNDKERNRYRADGGKEKVYAKNLARYDLTAEQYAARVEEQGGRCAICGDIPTRRLHVDHDHTTGAVRALLCSHCNHAIGQAKEDPARLRAMIAYLEHHAAAQLTPKD